MTSSILNKSETVWNTYFFDEKKELENNDIPLEFFYSMNKTTLNDRISNLFSYLEKNNCQILDQGKVREFLINHQNLDSYLWSSIIHIRRKFDSNQKILLNLFFEDTKNLKYGELFINIKSNLDIEESYKKIREIDEHWLFKIKSNEMKFLNINIDF